MTEIIDQPAPIHASNTNRRPAWELTIEWTKITRDRSIEMMDTIPEAVREANRIALIEQGFNPMIEDMIARDKIGRERYGTPLTADNGRDHLVDGYQEALDLMVYLVAELDQRGEWPLNEQPSKDDLRDIVVSHVNNMLHLRRLISLR